MFLALLPFLWGKNEKKITFNLMGETKVSTKLWGSMVHQGGTLEHLNNGGVILYGQVWHQF